MRNRSRMRGGRAKSSVPLPGPLSLAYNSTKLCDPSLHPGMLRSVGSEAGAQLSSLAACRQCHHGSPNTRQAPLQATRATPGGTCGARAADPEVAQRSATIAAPGPGEDRRGLLSSLLQGSSSGSRHLDPRRSARSIFGSRAATSWLSVASPGSLGGRMGAHVSAGSSSSF